MGINLFHIHVSLKAGREQQTSGVGPPPSSLVPEHFPSAAARPLERPGSCLLPWETASHLLCCCLCTLLLSEPQPPSLNNGGMQAMTGQRERPFHTDLPQPLQEPEVTDNQQRIPRTRCVSPGRASVCVFQNITGLLTPSARHFDAPPFAAGTCTLVGHAHIGPISSHCRRYQWEGVLAPTCGLWYREKKNFLRLAWEEEIL